MTRTLKSGRRFEFRAGADVRRAVRGRQDVAERQRGEDGDAQRGAAGLHRLDAGRAAPRAVEVERVDLPPPGRAGSVKPARFLRGDVREAADPPN